MEHLDQLLLLLLFVVLPLAQRAVAWLGERRKQAVERERARRADLDVGPRAAPSAEAGLETRDEREDAQERGEVLWKRMLEAMGVEEELEEPAPAPIEPLRPGEPRRAAEVVAPAQPAHAPPVHLGEALPAFEVAPLATVGPAVGEDEIEAGGIGRAAFAELSGFDTTERSEVLATLPGFAPSAADAAAASQRATARGRSREGARAAAGADWRRAIVLAEVLAPPLALRGHDAEGLWSRG